jgi:hypothetical protein
MGIDGASHKRRVYHMCVLTSNVADAVQNVAGLIVERVLLGWHVSVAVDSPSEMRPLNIVGAQPQDFREISELEKSSSVGSLVVSADLIRKRSDTRHLVRSAICEGETELLIWGAASAAGLRVPFTSKGHALSAAARAFKSQALVAIGQDPLSAASPEVFSFADRPASSKVRTLHHSE